MILREIFLETNENGVLLVNDHILSQMGIGKNEQIYIPFILTEFIPFIEVLQSFAGIRKIRAYRNYMHIGKCQEIYLKKVHLYRYQREKLFRVYLHMFLKFLTVIYTISKKIV